MKSQPLWKISVATSSEGEEAVQQLLERLYGHPASTCTDLITGAIVVNLFLTRNARATRPPRAPLLAALRELTSCGLDLSPARVSIRQLKAENWAESWKRHFHPLEIGRTLLIKPSWSRRLARAGQATVVLDPGLSFGTGQHPTTSFCLEQIAAQRRPGAPQGLLDVGCGSGILAIAAAKLGYAPVVAFDFDPDAVRIARENAARNDVSFRLFQGDVTQLKWARREQYDVVCANLTHDLLLSQAQRLTRLTRPDGLLVLAGILDKQFAAVQAAYEGLGLTLSAVRTEREWRSGAFRRLADKSEES